jgi:serine/threonine protein phosphatase PrpC
VRTITSHATHIGKRPYQEDRTVVSSGEDGLLLSVFDGHGGADVAELCRKSFVPAFNYVIENEPTFPSMSEKIAGVFGYLGGLVNSMKAGSTASIVYIPSALDKAYVGVLGDSPVIIREIDGSIWRSPEHNVRSNPEEVIAAKTRGATIFDGYMFAGRGLTADGLQLTRALGDFALDSVLDRSPQIFELSLGAGSFVLVASDGLLDPGHQSTKAQDAIVNLIDKGGEAGNLVKYAIDVPTGDNASAILVRIIE